ncbi:hypothetical protein CLAFUW4_01026 [Fulvia fulva]|uniref:uncharacterized protein n=1 Tax=Passalora fulva TaxID=5499 RepID=UPI0028527360|nr:uncharacterized protein CLAFUR5_20126 [Fulvia fulva]KAK4635386.1 hypothetical protein CLAFUR4_01027 [Fulvia fulva]KAK4638188.1 hypothetical protein CLAFUR0_01028 [Fulvia fulva]WMI38756.1 hypothetical protein CLAFUR5_20126 [Fulvia fulva]WPV08349.1 hypothetical protein CLAFUW4_01026 [Fulvia fulva]WPV23367.1 hypothetical protein CLAFUW7_01031 [Fulvia fulva]
MSAMRHGLAKDNKRSRRSALTPLGALGLGGVGADSLLIRAGMSSSKASPSITMVNSTTRMPMTMTVRMRPPSEIFLHGDTAVPATGHVTAEAPSTSPATVLEATLQPPPLKRYPRPRHPQSSEAEAEASKI